jgi:hypothetical protein
MVVTTLLTTHINRPNSRDSYTRSNNTRLIKLYQHIQTFSHWPLYKLSHTDHYTNFLTLTTIQTFSHWPLFKLSHTDHYTNFLTLTTIQTFSHWPLFKLSHTDHYSNILTLTTIQICFSSNLRN